MSLFAIQKEKGSCASVCSVVSEKQGAGKMSFVLTTAFARMRWVHIKEQQVSDLFL